MFFSRAVSRSSCSARCRLLFFPLSSYVPSFRSFCVNANLSKTYADSPSQLNGRDKRVSAVVIYYPPVLTNHLWQSHTSLKSPSVNDCLCLCVARMCASASQPFQYWAFLYTYEQRDKKTEARALTKLIGSRMHEFFEYSILVSNTSAKTSPLLIIEVELPTESHKLIWRWKRKKKRFSIRWNISIFQGFPQTTSFIQLLQPGERRKWRSYNGAVAVRLSSDLNDLINQIEAEQMMGRRRRSKDIGKYRRGLL